MKKVLAFIFLIVLVAPGYSQQANIKSDQTSLSYFITHTREELMAKLVDLPCGIKPDDPVNVILQKLETFLKFFQPDPRYSDDVYAKAANIQALISVKEVGSVLIDADGKIIFEAHNSQIQKHRSDLHAEMTLLTDFEKSRLSKKYINLYIYKPGLTVFSSAEPCPMCFIRISIVGANTKYCTPGPEDGMVTRIDYLPEYWHDLALKQKVEIGDCSPVMQKISHLLFYSYLLDDRGPH